MRSVQMRHFLQCLPFRGLRKWSFAFSAAGRLARKAAKTNTGFRSAGRLHDCYVHAQRSAGSFRVRITYKLCLTAYKAINGSAPDYLAAMCGPISTNQARLRLRSSDSGQLLLPWMKPEFGKRAFAYAGPPCLERSADVSSICDNLVRF